jgi:hypothetical protein
MHATISVAAYFTTLSVCQTIWHRIIGGLLSIELERIWKEDVMVISQNVAGTEENTTILSG